MVATLESTPDNAAHWPRAKMAERSGLSASTIGRIWAAFELKPHRAETFKLSNDPLFTEKVFDVVGLYLNPPEGAVVLSVDEKPQVQALAHVVMIAANPRLPTAAGVMTAAQIAARLPRRAFTRASAGPGSKGPRNYRWARFPCWLRKTHSVQVRQLWSAAPITCTSVPTNAPAKSPTCAPNLLAGCRWPH